MKEIWKILKKILPRLIEAKQTLSPSTSSSIFLPLEKTSAKYSYMEAKKNCFGSATIPRSQSSPHHGSQEEVDSSRR